MRLLHSSHFPLIVEVALYFCCIVSSVFSILHFELNEKLNSAHNDISIYLISARKERLYFSYYFLIIIFSLGI